jgi:DNA-binding transcriptional regulator YiaG
MQNQQPEQAKQPGASSNDASLGSNIPDAVQLTWGKALRQERDKANFSQQQLAIKLNVSKDTISNWENDKSKPHFSDGLKRALYKTLPEMKQYEGLLDRETSPLSALRETSPQGITKIPAKSMQLVMKKRFNLQIITVSIILLCVIVLSLGAFAAIQWYISHQGTSHVPSSGTTHTLDPTITPQQLAQIPATTVDTLIDPNFLKWTMAQGNANERSCQFLPTGLHAIDRSNWPLALCFEQATPPVNAYAVQVDVTYPANNNSQPHGAGIILGASDFSDNASMYRVRIGSDRTDDIFVTTDDPTHTGRLDPCPSFTDPNAQSTLHNNYNDPISPHIKQIPGETNTITVVVVGRYITMYVNGYKIQTACDATPTAGLIGLYSASPLKNEVTEAVFTNLKIWTKF